MKTCTYKLTAVKLTTGSEGKTKTEVIVGDHILYPRDRAGSLARDGWLVSVSKCYE